MVCINQADHAGDVLALAARYGSHADAARAHHLLVERMRLPHHAVAQAYLALWKAYDAQRRRADSEKLECAQHAAHAFARLGWKRQRTEALVLTGKPHHTSVAEDRAGSSPVLKSLDPALTSREQQVAELVLRGLTNRAIAQTLAISEHTVETHMTSILNRLGLRSRWQLIDRSNS
jgi:DNA-binding CsgD family transcriptional regulator